MRTRTRLAGATALVAAAVAVIVAANSGGGDAARDVAARLDVAEARPLQVTLSGPLWDDRTIRDDEGTPDIAYLTHDESLTVTVRGRDGVRVDDIGYRIDGRPRKQLHRCDGASCPNSAAVTVVPALRRLGGGAHRIVIDARSQRPGRSSSAAIEATVGDRLPATREGEPVAAASGPAPPASPSTRLARATRAIITREQRTGVLRGVLGPASPRVVQIGELRAAGRRLGATVLLSLATARRAVRATVPGYLASSTGYRLQSVTFTAVVLRDLLIDVDLGRDRIIAVEPGPGSQTSRWSPQQAPTPSGAQDED